MEHHSKEVEVLRNENESLQAKIKGRIFSFFSIIYLIDIKNYKQAVKHDSKTRKNTFLGIIAGFADKGKIFIHLYE